MWGCCCDRRRLRRRSRRRHRRSDRVWIADAVFRASDVDRGDRFGLVLLLFHRRHRRRVGSFFRLPPPPLRPHPPMTTIGNVSASSSFRYRSRDRLRRDGVNVARRPPPLRNRRRPHRRNHPSVGGVAVPP